LVQDCLRGWVPEIESQTQVAERFFVKANASAELIETLKTYLATYNDCPRPFQWTATPEKILRKIAHIRLNVEPVGTAH